MSATAKEGLEARAFAPLLAVAIGLALFAGWGMLTESGRHRFDEMAGMIPLAAALASVLLFAAALAVRLLPLMRGRGGGR